MTAPAVDVQSIEHLDHAPQCQARHADDRRCEAAAAFWVTVHGHILRNRDKPVKRPTADLFTCSEHLSTMYAYVTRILGTRCPLKSCGKVFETPNDVILRVVAL